jgi:glyoxylase-like metal-dependent hydrolase (beta-lactamase superfamily II)
LSARVAGALSFVPRLPSTVYRVLLSAYCLLLSADSLLPTAYSLPPARGLYEIREIKPGVFIWVPDDVLDQDGDPQFSRAGTAGFIVTSEGVVVVNSTNTPSHARELLYEIRKRTDLPVRYVINTDSHSDLMLGNEVFVDQPAIIVSTSIAAAEMRRYRQDLVQRLREDENWRLQARMRGIHPTMPGQTFDHEMTIRLGGQEIRLLSMGGAHSAGDAVIYLPGAKILFLGHLFENGFFPRLASSDVRRWIETLQQVESWDVDTYVPGHGPPGDKRQLAEFRGFLEWLVTEIETRIQAGKSLEDVKREVNPLETFHWSARDLAPQAIEDVYRQLEQAQPAHAASPPPAGQAASPGQSNPPQ